VQHMEGQFLLVFSEQVECACISSGHFTGV
jgi:hypothetical protein